MASPDHKQLALDIAADMADIIPNRTNQFNPSVTLGTIAALHRIPDARASDVGVWLYVLAGMGGREVDGLGCRAVSDTAEQLAHQLAKTPGHIRNVLSRGYKAGLLDWQSGSIRTRSGGVRTFASGPRSGPRVVVEGAFWRVLTDHLRRHSSSPPGDTRRHHLVTPPSPPGDTLDSDRVDTDTARARVF